MPTVEILDGPQEWAGAVFESPDDMVEPRFGLCHPRWKGTPLASRALYAYRKVETVGDRHRYRYQGPWGFGRHGEDLAGWDVLVVQEELESGDPLKLWGSLVRVYAAPPGTARPVPGRPPEDQGWQELTEGGHLRRRRPGSGRYLEEALARRMGEGDPWVVEQWRRLAGKQGPAKDAEAERIQDEQVRMHHIAGTAKALARLRPDAVRSWTSDPPYPRLTTYIPMIGDDLAAIPGMIDPEWVALQDRVLLVVHPVPDSMDAPVFGSARVYGAPPGTRPPGLSVAPEEQGWRELDASDFLVAWLLHIGRADVVYG
jgi:hypothetical protein